MRHVIILPDLGQTTNEATVRQFLKKPGDQVKRGEPILAVSTDKVEMEVESFASGYLRQWLAEEGALASAMSPVAIITDTADESYATPEDDKPEPPKQEVKTVATSSAKAGPVAVKAAPAARVLAKERGIDLNRVSGTGPDGLITKADVLAWTEQAGKDTASSTSSLEIRALSAMAATVTTSKREIPHFYATSDVSMSHAAEWRGRWNKEHPDLPATYNDVFVFCAARSLRDIPRLNIGYNKGSYRQSDAADVLLIVAHEPTMLLVPLADPTELSWDSFLKSMKRAVQPNVPTSAGTPLLAISNLGMFGIKQFAAIIPPNCTSVLAIGAVREQPVIKNGKLEGELVCSLTLSADHRVVDGVAAARFLERIQFHLNSL